MSLFGRFLLKKGVACKVHTDKVRRWFVSGCDLADVFTTPPISPKLRECVLKERNLNNMKECCSMAKKNITHLLVIFQRRFFLGRMKTRRNTRSYITAQQQPDPEFSPPPRCNSFITATSLSFSFAFFFSSSSSSSSFFSRT